MTKTETHNAEGSACPLDRQEAGQVKSRWPNTVLGVGYVFMSCLHWEMYRSQIHWGMHHAGSPTTGAHWDELATFSFGLAGTCSVWSAVRGWQLYREVKAGWRSKD